MATLGNMRNSYFPKIEKAKFVFYFFQFLFITLYFI